MSHGAEETSVAASAPKHVSTKQVQLVQNLIERCMQSYISRAQVINLLQTQAKIEPGFTMLVWQKLEEQNPDFFRHYNIRLKLKEQIVMFNYLLEQQVNMVQKLCGAWMSVMSPPPGMPFPSPPMMPPAFPAMPPGMAWPPPAMPMASLPRPPAPGNNASASRDGAAGSSSAAAPLSAPEIEDFLGGVLEGRDLSAIQLYGSLDNLLASDDFLHLGAGISDMAGAGGSTHLQLDLNNPSMARDFSFSDLQDLAGVGIDVSDGDAALGELTLSEVGASGSKDGGGAAQ